MSEQNPLLVPMTVEAMVVNNPVRYGPTQFVRTDMQYNRLAQFKDAQPGLSNNDTAFTQPNPVGPNHIPSPDYYNGVYLKWRFPANYTHGLQNSVTGTTDFPPVPNRWLIVRYSGPWTARIATAWVVESDYLYSYATPPSPNNMSQQPARYVSPDAANGNQPNSVYMGRNTLLGTWDESGNSLGLTAMGPGNPAFAFYQPSCNNVFSFMDPLNLAPAETLSYMVLGWFSDPASDPLNKATPQDFLATLKELKWELPPDVDLNPFTNFSMVYGIVTGVDWQTAVAPSGGTPQGTSSIAVGNTAIEALTALVEIQAQQQGVDVDAALLEAFQLGLIDELDQPGGAAVVDEKIRESYFQRFSGGYRWDIVDAPDVTEPVSPEEFEKEMVWLQQLNAAQAAFDSALTMLRGLQNQLYIMWWKYKTYNSAFMGKTPIPGLDSINDLLAQLNAGAAGTIAQLTNAQRDAVLNALKQIPHGVTTELLEASIQKYADDHDLPVTRQLKRSADDNFYLPNNPVVLIAGAGTTGIVDKTGTLLCRLPSNLVTGVVLTSDITVTAATPNLTIPQPNLSGVTGVPWTTAYLTQLVNEFFLLDPTNATMVQAALPSVSLPTIQAAMANPECAVGVYPSGAVERWIENPWHPLQLIWQVTYYPIEYGEPSDPNWTYSYGAYYWNGASSSVDASVSLGGSIQLSAAASFNLKARIIQFLADNPYLSPDQKDAFEKLLAFVQEQDGWDLLSQALNGFNGQLDLRNQGIYISPATASVPSSPDLAELIGNVRGFGPMLGNIPTTSNYTTNFRPWRAGQFMFLNLVVVDEWGQAIYFVNPNNYKTINLFLPPDLSPIVASNPMPLTVTAQPAISNVAPSVAVQGSTPLTLTVNGVNFATGAQVMWNSTALSTTVVSSTQLTATVSSALLATTGTAAITVVSGGQTSPSVPFLITAGCGLESISPQIVLAGMAQADSFPLTVTGVQFAAGAAVNWNGKALTTTFASPEQLTAEVPAASVAAPGTATITVTSAGVTSNPLTLTIAAGAMLDSIEPSLLPAGSPQQTLQATGVGFVAASVLHAGTTPLATTFINSTQISAELPASAIAAAGTVKISEAVGHRVLPDAAQSLVQMPPALLQPARLLFDLVDAATDGGQPGPLPVDVDPICGWVIPNHLDAALGAYTSAGIGLGELSVGVDVNGQPHVCWHNAPYSIYTSLQQIAESIPHFGPFLLALSTQDPETFNEFLRAIDETLWSTAPADSAFDDHLAVLVGRPLAMLRARLQFQFEGPIEADPSWQYTFQPATPPVVSGYKFAVQLGDIANVEDGLVGYFENDNYERFNVLPESGSTSGSYLDPIGVDNNYIYLPTDNQTAEYISMLVDPRAAVHARTAILPDDQVTAPPEFVSASLAAMDVTFRIDGILTDQQITAHTIETPSVTSVVMPLPKVDSGTWSWVEFEEAGPVSYPVLPNDTTARLSEVEPVLRRGVLQLSGALSPKRSLARRGRSARSVPKPTRS